MEPSEPGAGTAPERLRVGTSAAEAPQCAGSAVQLGWHGRSAGDPERSDGDATRRTKAAADTGLGRVRSDGPEAASEPGASFVVYVRTYCHLCDEMLAELETMRSRQAFTVEVIDIDADPALEALYGEWVPVLEAHGRRLCHYRLDPDAVAAYLSAIG